MTTLAPPDRALGRGAAVLLDGEAMRARLETVSGGDVTCMPRYARWKPETSLLVQYEAAIGGRPALLHAWLFADARTERTWTSRSYERLVDRARRRHPELPFAAALLLDSGALVEASPVDSRLPALVRAASLKKLARLLAQKAPRGLREAQIEILRHKPGRKALLRLAAPAETLYVKVHAGRRAGGHAALARAVGAAGVPTATPRTVLRDLEAIVYEEAHGTRLADLRGAAGYADWFVPAAEALAQFHRSAPISVAWTPETHRLSVAGRAVDALVPRLNGAGGRLAAAIAERLGEPNAPVVLAHGDFYDDQLLVGGGHVVILDLDEARPGHPLLDVGNFLAHLTAASREPLRPLFLEACERAGFELDGVLAFEAAALLALAVRPFRRLEPDWPERVERIAELAADRLAEDRRPFRPQPDPVLPQLRTLAEPPRAGRALSRALGRPVAVSSVAVIRQKVGRRCTLRYRLDDGETVFAKTYASGRAGRVYESLRRISAVAGLRTPAPLGWDRATNLVVTRRVHGEPVRERIVGGEVALGREIAGVLHALHRSEIELVRRHSLADEVGPLTARVERIAAIAPELASAAARCGALVLRGSTIPWAWRRRPVHRDFYEDQILDGNSGLGILDLDDSAMSEPAVDVANLIAHLTLLRIRTGHEGPVAVARAFRGRYRALDPDLDGRLVSFLVGATLLRLADIHLERAGRDVARRLLVRGESVLCRALDS